MWDFPDSAELGTLICDVWERGAVVAAVCHGPAGLTSARLADGSLLIDGKKLTGFSNAAKWHEHVVTDGRLVTGQNPASAAGVARMVLDLVG